MRVRMVFPGSGQVVGCTMLRNVKGLAVITLLVSTCLMPRTAHAHSATATITCSEVSFFFQFFPPSGVNTINETVSVDSVVVTTYTYQFVGSTSSNNLAISVPVGTHT